MNKNKKVNYTRVVEEGVDSINNLIEENKVEEAIILGKDILSKVSNSVNGKSPYLESYVCILEQISSIYCYYDNFTDAESYLLKAWKYNSAKKVPELQKARIACNLGLIYRVNDLYDESISFYNEALSIYSSIEPLPLEDLALIHNNLGMLYKNLGDFSESEENYLKSIDLYENSIGLKSLEVGTVFNNLSSLYQKAKYFNQAKEMNNEALNIRLDISGNKSSDVAQSYSNQGSIHFSNNEFKEAASYYKKSLDILEDLLPENADEYSVVANNYYDLLNIMGSKWKSDKFSNKAKKIFKKKVKNTELVFE